MCFHGLQSAIFKVHTTSRAAVLARIFLLILSARLPAEADAQIAPLKARSFRDRVVDRISLNDKTQVWGMLLNKKPTRVLVNTSWMRTNCPEFYEKDVAPQIHASQIVTNASLAKILQQEIDLATTAEPETPQRTGLLKEIRDRLTPDETSEPKFVILELPKSRVTNVDSQTDERRELCRLALLNNIQDIEETHWKSIAAQLQAIPEVDRKRTHPQAINDDQKNLEQILAAVDVRLNAASRLIQTGSTVVDESAEPDLSLLLNSMLGGNVQSLLGELLNEGQPGKSASPPNDTLPDAARRVADTMKHSTVVLSSFDFDIAMGSATVTRRLFHKGKNGQWKLLLASRETSTAADVKPGQIEAIEDDPQVKEIAGLMEGLGLGDGQLSNALQMGAVVQNALSEANQKFESTLQDIITARSLTNAQEPPLVVLQESRTP